MAFKKLFGPQRGYFQNDALSFVAVTVNASSMTGTATVPANATVFGAPIPTGNVDQHVSNVGISGTTLTVTLKAAATANNTFNVPVLNMPGV